MKKLIIDKIDMGDNDSLMLSVQGSAEKVLCVWMEKGVLYFSGPSNITSRRFKLTRGGIVEEKS